MDKQKRKLIIEQLDQKLWHFKNASSIIRPEKGWINAIRTSLNMSLVQLGNRINTSAQGAKSLEVREASGSVTLNGLKEAAEALEMKLVYAILPKDESLEKLIEKRAYELAKTIVMRTSASMKLEDQENNKSRLTKAVTEKAKEIKEQLPKFLWD